MKSPVLRSALVLGAVLVIALLAMEMSMKACLFSATRGVVTRNGAPVANAEVSRTYNWGWLDSADSDSTRTDAQGRFSFDAVWKRTMMHGVLPLHRSVMQEIFVRVDGKEYRAWSFSKPNFDDLGEVGRPLELNCELAEPDKNRQTHWGIAQLAP